MSSKHTTHYLDLPAMSELVAKVGLRPFIRKMVEALREDYSRWEEFEKSPRTANHSAVGVIELMPISDEKNFSFKYVNGHPANPKQNLCTVMAFGAYAEVETGFPVFISEMTILTALRTCATSALAASFMARPESKTMAMIGNGAQSEFQIIAFNEILGIDTFHLYDVDPKATDKLMQNLSGMDGIKLVRFNSTPEAVAGVDIITTCTADKKNATVLMAADVTPGMHVNGIGGDCPGKTELDKGILQKARVVVEYAPQSRIEGDIQQMPADFPVIELFEVLTGKETGRADEKEITVFDSVGFGLEDFSGLRTAYALAKEYGIGSELEIMPSMSDVKNLFGLLKVEAAAK